MINGSNSRGLSHMTGNSLRKTTSRPEFDLLDTIKKPQKAQVVTMLMVFMRNRLRFAAHALRMHPAPQQLRGPSRQHKSPNGSQFYGCDEIALNKITCLVKNRRWTWSKFMSSQTFWHLRWRRDTTPYWQHTWCIVQTHKALINYHDRFSINGIRCLNPFWLCQGVCTNRDPFEPAKSPCLLCMFLL